MPIALVAALLGSLSIHAAALFLPEVDLSPAPEPPPLTAELIPPPQLPEAPPVKPAEPPPKPRPVPRRPVAAPVAAAQTPATPVNSEPQPVHPQPEPAVEPVGSAAKTAPSAPALPATPVLAASGRVRYAVYRGDRGFEVGRAEHAWEFADGNYRVTTLTETSGLVALFKSVRVELESSGTLTARGLRPDRFITRGNGAETRETAEFDWSAGEAVLARDGSRRAIAAGAQDLASFYYQLAYLPRLDEGVALTVVSGRKVERYRFDSLGEEEVTVPAGTFRTLHLRVQTDSVTELWLAPDRGLLPVKIRHSDKKGEAFEEHAVELGRP